MERIEYRSLDQIQTKGNLKKIVLFKPKLAIVICAAIGVALGIFVPNLLAKILGLFFALMAMAVVFLVPERKVIDIYDQGVLIYSSRNSEQGFWLDYDDVAVWKIEHIEGHDTLEFELKNGQKIGVDTFQVNSAYRILNDYMHDKEYHIIEARKSKEKPLKLPEWVMKRFSNNDDDKPSSED